MTDNQSISQLTEERIKHLEMLQQIITRMASNSFLLKGWTVTLVAAILALIDKTQLHTVGWVALLPILSFWMLDGYFLHQERLFRKLYDYVRQLPNNSAVDFDMNTSNVDGSVSCVLGVMFSNTLLFFYLGLVVAVCIVMKFT